MSDNETSPAENDKDISNKDVELHNPNFIEEESDEYEEVDDAEPFKDSPEEELKQATGDADDDDDDEDVTIPPVEGSYDPSDYDALDVDDETKELFGLIMKYTPQTVELDHKFKPFIPDYIPAVGDIDALLRCTRPDERPETLGLKVLDEPSARQSDPSVLELHMRVVSKQAGSSSSKGRRVKRIGGRDTGAMDKWIRDISDFHRTKPAPTIHYSKAMPDIDNLMQEWPEDMEDTLKTTTLPLADLSADLSTHVDIVCGLLDIPRYKYIRIIF